MQVRERDKRVFIGLQDGVLIRKSHVLGVCVVIVRPQTSSEPAVGQRNLKPHSIRERDLNVDQIADRATVKKMSLHDQQNHRRRHLDHHDHKFQSQELGGLLHGTAGAATIHTAYDSAGASEFPRSQ